MNEKNIIEGMEWGKDVFQYMKMNHAIGVETGRSTFLGINGPKGIGKEILIRKISDILEREFIYIDYVDWIHKRDSFSESYHENAVVFINDTSIENGFYSNGINCFIEKNKNKKNTIFVFSSSAILGANSPISSKLRMFLYGRLSIFEKISYAKAVINVCQKDLHLEKVEIPEAVLMYIITYYTKEAGVYSLSACIRNIYEYLYMNNSCDNGGKIVIEKEQLTNILGNEKYVFDEMIAKKCLQGIGVAWTRWGGTILPIEMLVMKGNGNLLFSGNIGNIMQESINVIFSYFRANYKKWGIKHNFFIKHNIHINIYEQSIYKDGSSAGLAFFVKTICTIKNISFKDAIAFSGEISLEGRVLRVGGLKEKLCVVQEQGIRKIVLPKQSMMEYQSIRGEIKENLIVYFIDDVMELKRIIQQEKR